MTPSVSIIIPVYNSEKYITECLDSIITQDFDNLEVLIIDDCGTDSSINICKKYESINGNKSVKIIHHIQNSGLSLARNTGIDAAAGEYLYFIDSDDYLTRNDAISLLLNKAHESKADIVSANNIMFIDESKEIVQHSDILYTDSNNASALNSTAWNKLVKKDFILNNNLYFDEKILHEDDVWSFKIKHLRPHYATCSETTYAYRVRQQSIMTSITWTHVYSRIKIPFLLYDYLLSHNSLQIIDNIAPLEYNALISLYLYGGESDIFIMLSSFFKKRYSFRSKLKYLLNSKGKKSKILSLLYITPKKLSILILRMLFNIDIKSNKGYKQFASRIKPGVISQKEISDIYKLIACKGN